MLLNYARELAEMHTKESIKDAVISVPVFFGQAERQGLLDAAEIAGLNVLSLINEHAGAALQYGIDKDFTDEDRYVVFYDMGASNTYAALVHFTAYTGKSPGGGKNITFQQFHVSKSRVMYPSYPRSLFLWCGCKYDLAILYSRQLMNKLHKYIMVLLVEK